MVVPLESKASPGVGLLGWVNCDSCCSILHLQGFVVPDELGYLAPLGSYASQDVVLQLPGEKTIFQIDWLAVYNRWGNLSNDFI